jgi:hypothetical protein
MMPERRRAQIVIHKKVATAMDKLTMRMRTIIDAMPADERDRVLKSVRAISSDLADRLKAPSSRSH